VRRGTVTVRACRQGDRHPSSLGVAYMGIAGGRAGHTARRSLRQTALFLLFPAGVSRRGSRCLPRGAGMVPHLYWPGGQTILPPERGGRGIRAGVNRELLLAGARVPRLLSIPSPLILFVPSAVPAGTEAVPLANSYRRQADGAILATFTRGDGWEAACKPSGGGMGSRRRVGQRGNLDGSGHLMGQAWAVRDTIPSGLTSLRSCLPLAGGGLAVDGRQGGGGATPWRVWQRYSSGVAPTTDDGRPPPPLRLPLPLCYVPTWHFARAMLDIPATYGHSAAWSEQMGGLRVMQSGRLLRLLVAGDSL